MKTRYVNAQVYRGGRFAAGSLLVEDGRMAADTPGTAADRTVDLGGRHAVPGLVDVHVHLREPGFPHKVLRRPGQRRAPERRQRRAAAIRPAARCRT